MSDYKERFGGIERLYGIKQAAILKQAHFCIIGIGGVGSWAAEALARSGVCKITLIDHDDIASSNINRQIHSTSDTLNQSKVEVMARRIESINPDCECHTIDDFLTETTMEKYLSRGYDYVIDASKETGVGTLSITTVVDEISETIEYNNVMIKVDSVYN